MTNRTIVVTGASGLVGSALCEDRIAQGWEVRGTSRDPAALRRKLPSLRGAEHWPLPSPEILKGAHAVVHLAGENVGNAPWTAARKRAIEGSRIDGTRALVAQIVSLPEAERPKVLVSASAIGFYGETGDREVDERSPRGQGFLAELCEKWEHEALAAERAGVRVVTPRLGLVLSTQGGALGKQLLLYKAGLGGKLGPGTQYWPVVHIDDVIAAITFAIENDAASGALNVTAPHPPRQIEFAKALGAALNRPAIVPAPSFALKTLLGEFSQELLESRHVVPRRLLELGYAFRFPELRTMVSDVIARGR